MTEFQSDFKELLFTGENSDVTIKVKNRKFNCHSIILGARSPVLKAMLEHDMKEKRCGEITITDSTPTVFEEFLLYLYSGSEKHLNVKNITELYDLGDKYFMGDLKDLCVKRMISNMSTENFFEIFLFSQQHNDTILSKAATQLFLKHSESIVNSKKWMGFLRKYPDHTDVLITKLQANK